MAAKVPGFANAVGYWGRNPACRIVTDQTAAKIRALLQDQLLANGRPVWLWQPVSSAAPGVVACTCDKNTTQSADFKCMSCFVPGTLVRTEQGYIPIEDVKIGMRVLTSSGEFHRVTEVHQRQFEGDLVEVTSAVSPEGILVTPAHPFLALTGHEELAAGCSPARCNAGILRGDNDGNQYGYDVRWLERLRRFHARASWQGRRFALGAYDSVEDARAAIDEFRQQYRQTKHRLDWKVAAELSDRDYVVAGWPKTADVDLQFIEIPKEFCRRHGATGKERLGPARFKIDADFLWMIGMYIAEGSHSARTVIFSLHQKEVDFQQRLVRIFRAWGFRPQIRFAKAPGLGVTVLINSTTLAQWLPAWIGTHCHNKKIPEEIMRLPATKLSALVQGIDDGDGTKAADENEITQTSKVLALQIAEILHRLGDSPLVRRVESRILAPSGRPRRLAFSVNWRLAGQSKERKRRWNFKGDNLAKIRTVGRYHYHGPVYNLEVENDPTYVVEGVVVHNCFGTKFAPGYLKFLHTTLHWSSAAAGGYTLVNAALDYTKKPNRVQLVPGQATGTITTTDQAFSNPTSEDWEIELMAYRRVAGDTIALSYSLDAGATWTPVALTESPRIGFLGTLTGALKPVGAGNIRFRVTLTRASGATAESPSFEILRARYLRRRDVNPALFGSTGYQAGQILLLKTWETEVVSRQVAQGRLIEHEGDRSWTAPFDFFDLSLTRDTPPVALDDRNPGAHPFFEATSGVRQGRYAMMAVSLDTTIQNIMTHQSLTERLVQPGEMYGLVW